MRIAIIGGGMAGLTAAFVLTQKGRSVVVLEKEQKLGGLISSYQGKDWLWPVERYYHHFFASDKEIFNLAKELGLLNELFLRNPKTSVLVNGKIYRFDNPGSVLAFPKLNFFDKIRVGFTTAFLKLNPFWRPLEKITASSFIRATMGENVFRLIWQPLLESKFSSFAEKIPASWFWTRIKKRSFRLSYFNGGADTLINALSAEIKKAGGKILLGEEVTKLQKTVSGFELSTKKDKSPLKFEKIISTVSPQCLARIFPDLPSKEKENLNKLKSLGCLSLLVMLKESFLTDGTYWLNITDKGFPFVAVVEHTNLVEKKYYGENTLLYVGGYYPVTHPFFKMKKDKVFHEFLPYLKKINPNYNFSSLFVDCQLFSDSYSQPIPNLNYSANLPQLKTSVPDFYWASLHHVYPEDRGINYAILLGKKIAQEIENETKN